METQATTQAPKYDRMSKEALQIIEDTYLANRDIRRGLWPLCAEALHKQNIFINENDGRNRLSIIRRKYPSGVRGKPRWPVSGAEQPIASRRP
jgi:hypothetical protein